MARKAKKVSSRKIEQKFELQQSKAEVSFEDNIRKKRVSTRHEHQAKAEVARQKAMRFRMMVIGTVVLLLLVGGAIAVLWTS